MKETTPIRADRLIPGLHALDLAGDRYCENPTASYEYAAIHGMLLGRGGVTLDTSQGTFDVPASHRFKTVTL